MKILRRHNALVVLMLTSMAIPFILIPISSGQNSSDGGHLTTASGARDLLMFRLQQLESSCRTNLPAPTVLLDTVKQVSDFWDLRTPLGENTQDSVSQNGSNLKLKDTAYQAEAFVIQDYTGRIFPKLIFLRPNFFSEPSGRVQANVLLHELLHIHFNLGDSELCHHFGLTCTASTSHKITDWLGNGCRSEGAPK